VLDRIDKVEEDIKAFLTVDKERALEISKKVDKEGDFSSPLAGIPVAIKDNICTKDLKTTIIFAETPKAMASYGIEALGLDEQLLLPYTELGINIARELYNGRIIKKAIEKAVGKALEPAWGNADFSLPDGRQGVVLVTNDIEKRSRLQDYFRMARYRHTKTQEIVIVCLESQKEVFAQEFPRCEIISINEEELFENQ